jgi:nitrogen fixation/metabolism regulation signal transduction histidine kinase
MDDGDAWDKGDLIKEEDYEKVYLFVVRDEEVARSTDTTARAEATLPRNLTARRDAITSEVTCK